MAVDDRVPAADANGVPATIPDVKKIHLRRDNSLPPISTRYLPDGRVVIDLHGEAYLELTLRKDLDKEDAAHARRASRELVARVVACIRACEGIPKGLLEHGQFSLRYSELGSDVVFELPRDHLTRWAYNLLRGYGITCLLPEGWREKYGLANWPSRKRPLEKLSQILRGLYISRRHPGQDQPNHIR